MNIANKEVTDVIIVGGGLSGVIVAREIHNMNDAETTSKRTWKLLEARHKLGGRLENDSTTNSIDLGGAWIWPPQQVYMVDLIQSLDEIVTFDQPDDSSSTRIVGGAARIVEEIMHHLPRESIQLNSPVVSCKLHIVSDEGGANTNDGGKVPVSTPKRIVQLDLSSGEEIFTRNVVFAVPPKLLSLHVTFNPPLSNEKAWAMSTSKTWMAGVTKVALVYNSKRFWPLEESNRGLRSGPKRPAFQVYDSSPHESSTMSAFTFFTHVTSDSCTNSNEDDEALARQCADQMCDSFSSDRWTGRVDPTLVQKIMNFDSFHIKRWPHEKYISEDMNPKGINPHPKPNPNLARSDWEGSLIFAGTETDLYSPGLMEGAVSSALRAVKDLKEMWSTDN